ncbi:MAG: alcohol dehydrogenase catalytic domain-containing protein [Aggregatilineales bacterium]
MKSLFLTAPRQLTWQEDPTPQSGAGEVLVQTTASATSIGAELPQYRGDARSDSPTTYPKMTGYENVATVVATGKSVENVIIGQRVIGFYGYQTHAVMSAQRLIPMHVDREVLPLLEMLYFKPYRQCYIDEDAEQNEHSWQTWLISPSPEYTDFITVYLTGEHPPPGFEIPPLTTPAALKSVLVSSWHNVSFDTYCADSPAYLLRWRIVVEKDGVTYNLLCGLQNDGYSIVVTGYIAVIYEFVAWLRRIIVDRTLYLYEWAGEGITLKPDMTAIDIEAAYEEQQAAYRKLPDDMLPSILQCFQRNRLIYCTAEMNIFFLRG